MTARYFTARRRPGPGVVPRAVGLPDLLVAAVAERERVTVLHYDSDFDLIAKITSRPARWVVPRASPRPQHSAGPG